MRKGQDRATSGPGKHLLVVGRPSVSPPTFISCPAKPPVSWLATTVVFVEYLWSSPLF